MQDIAKASVVALKPEHQQGIGLDNNGKILDYSIILSLLLVVLTHNQASVRIKDLKLTTHMMK